MLNIERINNNHLDYVTQMLIDLKTENFSLNSTIFNKKRIKLKSFQEIKKLIADKISKNYFWYVLKENENIVGYIFWYEYVDEMENDIYENVQYKIWVVDNLYLYPSFRNNWNWTKLMNKITEDFQKGKCEIIELTTNAHSIWEKFYKKLWFQDASILLCKNVSNH